MRTHNYLWKYCFKVTYSVDDKIKEAGIISTDIHTASKSFMDSFCESDVYRTRILAIEQLIRIDFED
jgi:hypothetical protein